MSAPIGHLRSRRTTLSRAWTSFMQDGTDDTGEVRPEILTSWQRSAFAVRPDVAQAPLSDEGDTQEFWRGSALQIGVSNVEDELRRTAQDGDLVLAVTDRATRILWTHGGRVMRRKAETVNFVAGAHWDDASVGTNALDLAGRLDAPAMVFSAEHYAPIVHNWVCWAAPLHDPVTGESLGVIDLSTTWDRAHPIGLATARVLARLIESAMPRDSGLPGGLAWAAPTAHTQGVVGRSGLVLRILGAPEARLDGRPLVLSRRQLEILALLALHTSGLSLDQLHAHLYGDQSVSRSTLKAEVSHLRAALHGAVSSRPYRLTMAVTVDADIVVQRVERGDVRGAVTAYGGEVMPGTDSPALIEFADFVAVSVREALLVDPHPDAVVRYSEVVPHDTEVIEHCLHRLGNRAHPARSLLRARLAVAGP